MNFFFPRYLLLLTTHPLALSSHHLRCWRVHCRIIVDLSIGTIDWCRGKNDPLACVSIGINRESIGQEVLSGDCNPSLPSLCLLIDIYSGPNIEDRLAKSKYHGNLPTPQQNLMRSANQQTHHMQDRRLGSAVS